MKKRTLIGTSILLVSLMIFSVVAVQSGYLRNDISRSQEIPSVNEQIQSGQEGLCDSFEGGYPDGNQLGISEIQVIKQIWDGSAWVESAEAEIGSTVAFKITITYEEVCGTVAGDIEVIDSLPSCLSYDVGSAIIFHGENEYYGETSSSDQQIYWDLTDTFGIVLQVPSNEVSIVFNTIVTGPSEPSGSTNMVSVNCVETCCDQPMQGYGEATIFVPGESPGEPNIEVTKLVKEDSYGEYEDSITVDMGDIDWVTFKILVQNTGDIPLDVTVEDQLPVGLMYDDHAAPRDPDTVSGHTLYWYFDDVAPGMTIPITYRAIIQDCDTYVNVVDVTGAYGCGQYVSDDDTATVYAIGCCEGGDITVEKYVKEDCCGSYTKHLSVDMGLYSYVSFKLIVHTTRAFELVSVRDILPEELSYVAGSATVNGVYRAPLIRGTSLYWNFTNVPSGYTFTILFEASLDDCGYAINRAEVKGHYDSYHWLTDADTATVTIYGCVERLQVEKLVSLDNNTWDDEVTAHIGDTLYFWINVSNRGRKLSLV
jgi:uncharacterized repeat protein (TIGR01451 family)